MIKAQIIRLILLSLLSIHGHSFAMKRKQGLSSTSSKDDTKSKRQETSQGEAVKRDVKSVQQDSQMSSFDELPLELKLYILSLGLETTIKSNSPFGPLDGVKEYLDALYKVNSEFKQIAEYLGCRNYISDNIAEPRYKTIAKIWFVPKEMRDLSQEALNEQLKSKISQNNKLNSLINHLHETNNISDSRPQLLIAGANPDTMVSDDKTVAECIRESECLHNLIPLLNLRLGFKRAQVDQNASEI